MSRKEIGGMLFAGIVIAAIGIAIMIGTWPTTTYIGGSEFTEGSEGGVLVGAILAGCGQIISTVAMIALGVRIGVQPEPAPVARTSPVPLP